MKNSPQSFAKIPSDTTPVSIFMAGSPGAGKTEFSNSMPTYAEVKTNTGRQKINLNGALNSENAL